MVVLFWEKRSIQECPLKISLLHILKKAHTIILNYVLDLKKFRKNWCMFIYQNFQYFIFCLRPNFKKKQFQGRCGGMRTRKTKCKLSITGADKFHMPKKWLKAFYKYSLGRLEPKRLGLMNEQMKMLWIGPFHYHLVTDSWMALQM